MKARFFNGPLHNQVLDVGEQPPDGWIAPTVPLNRDGNEAGLRPVVGRWDDPSRSVGFDLNEYGLSYQNGAPVYSLDIVHRANGSKFNLR